MVTSVRIRHTGDRSDLVERAVALITDRVRAKGETGVTLGHDADLSIDLNLDTSLGAEGFRIADTVRDNDAGPGTSDETHVVLSRRRRRCCRDHQTYGERSRTLFGRESARSDPV